MADEARFSELPDEPVASPAPSVGPEPSVDAPAPDANGLEAASDPKPNHLGREHVAADHVVRAERLKAQANDAFGANRTDDAVQFYVLALSELPERPSPPKPPVISRKGKERERDEADALPPAAADVDESVDPADAIAEPAAPESAEIVALRATLHANLAACYVKTVRSMFVGHVAPAGHVPGRARMSTSS